MQTARDIVIHEISYLGALGGTRPVSSGILVLSDDGVSLQGGVSADDLGSNVPGEFAMSAADMVAVGVEGPEQVERRVTATRLFLVGVFAFAWKKTEKRSYLVIETADGMALFECRSQTPIELRARLAPWLAGFRELSNPGQQPFTEDPGDRLRRLADLHREGLVTDAEFSAKRADIMKDL